MTNNLSEIELLEKIKEIWSTNKNSKELIKYCEILIEKNKDIDIEIYLIYLTTLVNLRQFDKVLNIIDENKKLEDNNEIIAFKIKLLFFLKKYEDCETYINSKELNEENKNLAKKTLLKINTIKPKKVNEITKKEKNNEGSTAIKEIIKEESKIEVSKTETVINNTKANNKKVKSKKINIKIVIPVVIALLILLVTGILFINNKNNDLVINTSLNNSNEELYISGSENIKYELPVGEEFEFISSVESDIKKDLYVSYRVSDESIATISEDGFFKGKSAGTVNVLTLNKNKVVNEITVEVIEETYEDEHTYYDSYENSYQEQIKELIKNYEKDYIEAVNKGDYSLIEKYLVKNGPLDKEHVVNIEKFYKDGIKENLKSFEINSIDEIVSGEYIVNVVETISITKDGEIKVKEFDSFYNIRLDDNGNYLIYEMEIKEATDVTSNY